MINIITNGKFTPPPPNVGTDRGYTAGGESFTDNQQTTFALIFPTETFVQATQYLTKQAHRFGTASSSTTHAYLASANAYVEKFAYGFETSIISLIALNGGTQLSSASASTTKGYYFGGNFYPAYSDVSSIQFANDVVDTAVATMPSGGSARHNSTGNVTTGYIHGGQVYGSANYKIPYSTATFSALSATLAFTRYDNASFSSLTKGYISGSYSYSDVSTDVMPFSTETITPLSASLAYSAYACSDCSNVDKGYYLATSSSFNQNVFIEFATETTGTLNVLPNLGSQQDPTGFAPSFL